MRAACSSCNRRIRIICFEEVEGGREAEGGEGESGRGLLVRCTCWNMDGQTILFFLASQQKCSSLNENEEIMRSTVYLAT